MIESSKAGGRAIFRRIFFNSQELRAGWRLLIFLAMVAALIKGSSLVFRRFLPGLDDDSSFLLREVTDFLVFLFASWVMGRMEHRTISDYGLPWRKMFRAQFWQGALLGFAAITGLLVAMRIAGVFSFGSFALHGPDILKWGAIWLLVFILVALREEFRARGYALFTLSSGIGFWPAAFVMSGFFALGHAFNAHETLAGVASVVLFGLLLCLFLRRSGNLWCAVGFHAAYDWGQTFFGVPDSGMAPYHHLFNSVFSGPWWLTGGIVGPEASVLTPIALALVALVFSRYYREHRYQLHRTPMMPDASL